jgi:hypothetical protein
VRGLTSEDESLKGGFRTRYCTETLTGSHDRVAMTDDLTLRQATASSESKYAKVPVNTLRTQRCGEDVGKLFRRRCITEKNSPRREPCRVAW